MASRVETEDGLPAFHYHRRVLAPTLLRRAVTAMGRSVRVLYVLLFALLSIAPAATFSAPVRVGGATAPATSAGQQLAWVLGAVNGEPARLTASTLKKHFTAEFLAALPVDQLRTV